MNRWERMSREEKIEELLTWEDWYKAHAKADKKTLPERAQQYQLEVLMAQECPNILARWMRDIDLADYYGVK